MRTAARPRDYDVCGPSRHLRRANSECQHILEKAGPAARSVARSRDAPPRRRRAAASPRPPARTTWSRRSCRRGRERREGRVPSRRSMHPPVRALRHPRTTRPCRTCRAAPTVDPHRRSGRPPHRCRGACGRSRIRRRRIRGRRRRAGHGLRRMRALRGRVGDHGDDPRALLQPDDAGDRGANREPRFFGLSALLQPAATASASESGAGCSSASHRQPAFDSRASTSRYSRCASSSACAGTMARMA